MALYCIQRCIASGRYLTRRFCVTLDHVLYARPWYYSTFLRPFVKGLRMDTVPQRVSHTAAKHILNPPSIRCNLLSPNIEV